MPTTTGAEKRPLDMLFSSLPDVEDVVLADWLPTDCLPGQDVFVDPTEEMRFVPQAH